MIPDRRPFRKARQGFVVTESYCPGCGMFIAASPRPQLLQIAEKLHRCASFKNAAGGAAGLLRQVVLRDLVQAREAGSNEFCAIFARIMEELSPSQPMLDAWLERSEGNVNWFCEDPIGAMHAAGIHLKDDVLKALQSITKGIAKNLRPGT